jgi:hypothetical protein
MKSSLRMWYLARALWFSGAKISASIGRLQIILRLSFACFFFLELSVSQTHAFSAFISRWFGVRINE